MRKILDSAESVPRKQSVSYGLQDSANIVKLRNSHHRQYNTKSRIISGLVIWTLIGAGLIGLLMVMVNDANAGIVLDPNWGDANNNTAICTDASTQQHPQLVSDGQGGAIITWDDYRSGNWDLYAQRVNATGAIQWTANGTAISTTTGNQHDPQLVSDGQGGAIITWQDQRSGTYDIYGQRINATGAVQWTVNGIPICTASGDQRYPQLVSDGQGGAIITWGDYRSGGGDVYAQRVNATGAVQWTANGILISPAANDQYNPRLVSDGQGGAIIAWTDNRNGNYDVYAQWVNASGTVQWTANGTAICTATDNQYTSHLVGDGQGGAIITWRDNRNGNYDIYAQRVNATGAVQWTVNGNPICTAANDQYGSRLVSDGRGGTIISWQDQRTGNNDVYAQRANASGAVQWTANGTAICTATGNRLYPQLVGDGQGGAIITWQDQRSGNYDIYTQCVNATGAVRGTANGTAICTAANDQYRPRLVSDGQGGAIITWQDHRSGMNIYAQRIKMLQIHITTINPGAFIDEDSLYSFDFDADLPGTWSLNTNASAWLAINSTTGWLNGTPTNADVGSYWVNVTAEGGTNGTDSHNFTLQVNNTNDPPTITTFDANTTNEDELYSVDYNATDVDPTDDILTWALETNATTWLSINAITGVLSGTPTNAHVGTHWVNVTASDGGTNGTDSHNFTLQVNNTNDPPSITTLDANSATEDNLYSVDYDATDVDPTNDILIWSLKTNATTWLSINPATGVLNGTPTNADVAAWWVNVSVSDGNSGMDFHNFTLTVSNVNDAPVFDTVSIPDATEDVFYTVTFSAHDIDNPNTDLNFYINTDCYWIGPDHDNATISGTPDNDHVGLWNFSINLCDGDKTVIGNFTLTVNNVNDAPTITTGDVTTATEGEAYSVEYNATDMDPTEDVLAWTLKTNATWLSINATSGILSGTPTNAHVGTCWVNVTVSDGNGGCDWSNFTLTVEPVEIVIEPENHPPVLKAIGDQTATVGELFKLTVNAGDADNDTLTYSLDTNASFINMDAVTGLIEFTPTEEQAGCYYLNVSVSDSNVTGALTDHENITLKIVKADEVTSIIVKADLDGTEIEIIVSDHDETAGTATVSIGKAKDVALTLDETVKVDFDGDGTDDTEVTLTGFDADGKPILSLKAISTDVKGETDEKDNTWLIILIIVGVIIVAVIVIAVMRKKKPEEEPKAGEEEEPDTSEEEEETEELDEDILDEETEEDEISEEETGEEGTEADEEVEMPEKMEEKEGEDKLETETIEDEDEEPEGEGISEEEPGEEDMEVGEEKEPDEFAEEEEPESVEETEEELEEEEFEEL